MSFDHAQAILLILARERRIHDQKVAQERRTNPNEGERAMPQINLRIESDSPHTRAARLLARLERHERPHYSAVPVLKFCDGQYDTPDGVSGEVTGTLRRLEFEGNGDVTLVIKVTAADPWVQGEPFTSPGEEYMASLSCVDEDIYLLGWVAIVPESELTHKGGIVSSVADFLEALDGLIVTQQDYYRAQEALSVIHDGRRIAWRRAEDAEYAAQVYAAAQLNALALSSEEPLTVADRNARIAALVNGGMTVRAVGARYGLSGAQVSRIARGLVKS